MKIERRNTFGIPGLLFISESKQESEVLDDFFGKTVGEDGLIAKETASVEVRLADGYAEHYVSLQIIKTPH